MQFKDPDFLYLLFLIIIPILIHLFQLQKFKKVAFTNVKLLKQIEQQTRQSSKIKKILILLSRIFLFISLILAFAQPFFTKKNNPLNEEIFIYLDNSFSMQAKGDKGHLLEKNKIDLIESYYNKDTKINLLTNGNFYRDVTLKELKNHLLKIEYYPIKKDIKTILLQTKNSNTTAHNALRNIILISDFQSINLHNSKFYLDSTSNYSFVQTLPIKAENISMDSIWIHEENNEHIKIKALVKSYGAKVRNLSVSLDINDKLYGKTTVNLNIGEEKEIEFSFPNTGNTQGKIGFNDNLLVFDNDLYFSINKREKTNILSIGKPNEFLTKIYNKDEFKFESTPSEQLDYSSILDQNLIVLNELVSFPKPLIETLENYVNKGGNIVIIPSLAGDIISYNNLMSSLNIGKINSINELQKTVTTINYSNPFFEKVFREKVDNFQYPTVNKSFNSSLRNHSSILQFNDQSDFISEFGLNNSKVYWISAPINAENSNFTSSPLIVPVFYNFGKQKAIHDNLYYTIGNKNEIVIKSNNSEDNVLHISNENLNFIPLQKKSINVVKIETEVMPLKNGVYQITNSESKVQIAYNFDRIESDLNYQDIQQIINDKTNANYYTSVEKAISKNNDQYKKHNFWQLFVIFALVFLGMEILLQKFLKN